MLLDLPEEIICKIIEDNFSLEKYISCIRPVCKKLCNLNLKYKKKVCFKGLYIINKCPEFIIPYISQDISVVIHSQKYLQLDDIFSDFNVTNLDIDITDMTLLYSKCLKNLTTLCFSDDNINDINKYFEAFQHLTDLNLLGCASVFDINFDVNLTNLKVRAECITAESFKHMNNLKKLEINGNPFEENLFRYIKKIQTLGIFNNNILVSDDIRHIDVEKLKIMYCKTYIPTSSLRLVKKFITNSSVINGNYYPNLEYLEIRLEHYDYYGKLYNLPTTLHKLIIWGNGCCFITFGNENYIKFLELYCDNLILDRSDHLTNLQTVKISENIIDLIYRYGWDTPNIIIY
jgi:hypothetical protein